MVEWPRDPGNPTGVQGNLTGLLDFVIFNIDPRLLVGLLVGREVSRVVALLVARLVGRSLAWSIIPSITKSVARSLAWSVTRSVEKNHFITRKVASSLNLQLDQTNHLP